MILKTYNVKVPLANGNFANNLILAMSAKTPLI